MAFLFTFENEEKIQNLLKRYPLPRSALLPLLDLAQRQNGGWLSDEALRAVADRLCLTRLQIEEVASFYSMFNLKPVGRYHIQVCRTLSCMLRGAKEVTLSCTRVTGLQVGETNNKWTLSEVECLGACVHAPVVQINDTYYENCTPESMGALLEELPL